jgi:hypothetical protein
MEDEFKVGDWVIVRENYLDEQILNKAEKILIEYSFPQEILLIDKLKNGKTIYHLNRIDYKTENIKFFRLATEMEIKQQQIKNMFKKK